MKPHTLHRLRQQFEIDRPEKDESKAVKKDRRAKVLLVQKADTAARRVNRASRREGMGCDAAALWREWYRACCPEWDQVDDIEAKLKEMRS